MTQKTVKAYIPTLIHTLIMIFSNVLHPSIVFHQI